MDFITFVSNKNLNHEKSNAHTAHCSNLCILQKGQS